MYVYSRYQLQCVFVQDEKRHFCYGNAMVCELEKMLTGDSMRTREQRVYCTVYTFINLKNTYLLNVVDDVYGCLVAERGVCRRACDVDKTQTLFILHTAIECINGKMFETFGVEGRASDVRYGLFFSLLLLSFTIFMYSCSAHFFICVSRGHIYVISIFRLPSNRNGSGKIK